MNKLKNWLISIFKYVPTGYVVEPYMSDRSNKAVQIGWICRMTPKHWFWGDLYYSQHRRLFKKHKATWWHGDDKLSVSNVYCPNLSQAKRAAELAGQRVIDSMKHYKSLRYFRG